MTESKINTLEKLIAITKTPEDLMKWMNDNIDYRLEVDNYSEEATDSTQSAEEMVKSKNGHCGEQSYLEYEVLTALGYKCHLIFMKENSSERDFGVLGSAHICVLYEDNDKYYWFEHAMEHMRGIHEYSSMNDTFEDIAKNWWKCVYNAEPDGSETDNFPLADLLEFRELDKPITHVSNYELAKRCYKFPILTTENISTNPTEDEMCESKLEEDSLRDSLKRLTVAGITLSEAFDLINMIDDLD